MTTTTVAASAVKRCPSCGRRFTRAQVGGHHWTRRRYCSVDCAAAAMTNPRAARNPNRDWEKRAACRTAKGIDFTPNTRSEAGPALAVCPRCPVRAECENEGLATGSYGIWGGRWLNPHTQRKGSV